MICHSLSIACRKSPRVRNHKRDKVDRNRCKSTHSGGDEISLLLRRVGDGYIMARNYGTHNWARIYLRNRFTEAHPSYAFELSSWSAEEYKIHAVDLHDALQNRCGADSRHTPKIKATIKMAIKINLFSFISLSILFSYSSLTIARMIGATIK